MVSLDPAGGGLVDAIPTFDRETPISGTSYAAPVVSGVAALVRSRCPELTARQVMQRIEATAHRPAGGWSPVIGNGEIDPQAAISTDPVANTAAPAAPSTRVVGTPSPPPSAQSPTKGHPGTIAILGTAGCAAAAAAALAFTAGRSRRAQRHHVAGD
jgi:membrane-anchored mycosin MYCP